MKKMNIVEMKNTNGGIASLCGWALFGWTVSCVAGAVKKIYFRR